ncbi:MAG TPA: hypothetical protein VE287_00710 [Actinopolymorphaceae bacterium]|nr:hypothetical protein [Actinopolymorphaceae bacterium]
MRRSSKVVKGGVIAGLTGLVLAGSVASAQFLSVADWFVGGGSFDHLNPVTASDGSITGPLMPGESANVSFTVHNPNRVSALVKVTSPVNAIEITDGPASCAQYLSYPGKDGTYHEAWRGSIPANGSVDITATNWVTVADDPASSCQNAKFKVKFGATGERNATWAQ